MRFKFPTDCAAVVRNIAVSPGVRRMFHATPPAFAVEPVVCFCRAADGTSMRAVTIIAPTVRFCFSADGAGVITVSRIAPRVRRMFHVTTPAIADYPIMRPGFAADGTSMRAIAVVAP